jgi:hypothetical protein
MIIVPRFVPRGNFYPFTHDERYVHSYPSKGFQIWRQMYTVSQKHLVQEVIPAESPRFIFTS